MPSDHDSSDGPKKLAEVIAFSIKTKFPWGGGGDPVSMNALGIKYSRVQVCAGGHVTAPYAFVDIPDADALVLMQGLRCPSAAATKRFGLCNRPVVRLLDHDDLMAAYILGGDEAVTLLLRDHRCRYGL